MDEPELSSHAGGRTLARETAFPLASYVLVGSGLYLQSMGEMWGALWAQTLALATLLIATFRPGVLPRSLPIVPRQLALLIVLGLSAMMVAMPPGVYTLIKTMSVYAQYLGLAAALSAFAAALAVSPRVLGRASIPLLLALVAAAGVWIIRNAPEPFIDLYSHHQLSCQAILEGKNPYAMTFPDIYGPDSPFTNEAMVQGGRTTYGFAYPPLMLYASLPGYVIFGDYRYSYLACLLIGAGFLAYSTRAWAATLACVLLLLAPRMFHVLESGWTEMPLFAALGVFVFLAARRSFWSVVPLAVLISAKQYMLVGLPLCLLMLPRPFGLSSAFRFCAIFGACVLLLHGPWMAWDWEAYYRSTVGVHANTPFRGDSVSWMSAMAVDGSAPWPNSVGILLGLAVAGLGVRYAKQGMTGFLCAFAASLLAFLLATRGFTNYFMMVLVFTCAGLAGRSADLRQSTHPIIEHQK